MECRAGPGSTSPSVGSVTLCVIGKYTWIDVSPLIKILLWWQIVVGFHGIPFWLEILDYCMLLLD